MRTRRAIGELRRHVVRVFRRQGARNARFIWAPNPNEYQSDIEFAATARGYWPGAKYVDAIGLTLVQFKKMKPPLQVFFARVRLVRELFGPKRFFVTEAKVYSTIRYAWLRELGCHLTLAPFVKRLVWSETESLGQAQTPEFGDMNWSLRGDPRARSLVRALRRPKCSDPAKRSGR